MHTSFNSLGATMPMNMRRRYSFFAPDAETVSDIKRICALWAWAKENWGDGGPYLFWDRFCAAAAFFAPLASRFMTYGILIDAPSEACISALLSHSVTEAFYRDAKAETWVMDHNELDID